MLPCTPPSPRTYGPRAHTHVEQIRGESRPRLKANTPAAPPRRIAGPGSSPPAHALPAGRPVRVKASVAQGVLVPLEAAGAPGERWLGRRPPMIEALAQN